MEYHILNNDTAVLVTYQPKIIYDDLRVKFTGAPSDATAIVEAMGVKLYRELNEDMCVIPKDKLNGAIKITLAVLNGNTPAPTWICDEITAEPTKDGGVLIAPELIELHKIITNLRTENNQIREENKEIKNTLLTLNKRLDAIMTAYDIT